MDRKEYLFGNETGDGNITIYDVFPGVQLAYYNAHIEHLEVEAYMEGDLIEIHHCREGRIEQEFDDEFFYLMPGDLSVVMRARMAKAYHFPLRHYHGISIGIDISAISGAFIQLLEESNIRPVEVIRKLRADRRCFIIRAEKYIKHVISELYTVPDSIREGYMKVKIVELLLVLSGVDVYQNQQPASALPRDHVNLAHQAAAYLSEHMSRHITIPELSRKFGVSDTHLKTVFRGVYGVPVFTYIRIQKMQMAAYQLIHTDKTVAEIADEFGYANAGKFSAAFSAVMEETPRDYRRNHMSRGTD